MCIFFNLKKIYHRIDISFKKTDIAQKMLIKDTRLEN